MFTPFTRILLAILAIVMAIYFYTESMYLLMVMNLFTVIFLIYGYYKYGTVYIAFQALKKERFDKAEKLISKIKNPTVLSKGQKSYYHYIQGYIAANRREWEKSYSEFTKALAIGLRTKNDTSIALLNLASIEFERKNFEQAKECIEKVRTFDLKPIIALEADRIEEEINAAQLSRLRST